MEWEKLEIVEISLACGVSSYASAELGDFQKERQRDTLFESAR